MNCIEKEIEGILINIIKTEMNSEMEKLDYEKNLLEYGFNSISIIKAIVTMEENYNIEFDDEYLSFEKLGNINDISNYIRTCLSRN